MQENLFTLFDDGDKPVTPTPNLFGRNIAESSAAYHDGTKVHPLPKNSGAVPNHDATRVQHSAQASYARAENGATRVQPSASKKQRSSSGGGRGGGGNKNNKNTRKKTRKIVFRNIVKTLFVLICIGLIAFSFLAVSISKYIVAETANDDVLLNLEQQSTSQNSYIMAWDADKQQWVEYQPLIAQGTNSVWVSLNDISPYLVDAVIATEDKDFLKHKGFSPTRTVGAALNEVFHFRSTFGGSTLDQQLVKNLTGDNAILDKDGNRSAGYQRKLKEIFRAVGLNNQYSKEMILEAYLNTMPLSGTIVGVQAGAKEYFYKEVKDLSIAEAAMIAGITKAPGDFNPYVNPDNCKVRRDDVLTFMYQQEKITKTEYDAALAESISLYDGPRQADQNAQETGVTSYFSDAVFEEVINDMVKQGLAPNREMAGNLLYTRGYYIEATVDLKLQAKMEEVYALGYEEGGLFPEKVTAEATITHDDGSTTTETVHPQSAMAVVNYQGELVGVVGGLGEKTISLGLNRATQSPRPIGSAMKPIGVYALGIDYGVVNYSSLIMDTGIQPNSPPNIDPETGRPKNDWPRNYTGPPTGNPVILSDAVAQSLNTVPVRIATWLGKENLYEFLSETLEISTLVQPDDVDYSPLVLGGMHTGISAYELAAAYTIFGGENNYGVFNSAHCYKRVLDADGNVIMEPEITTVQAISPQAGYVVNRLMSNVLRGAGGTANGMGTNYMDSVAKTGTTSNDKDRWFVGLTPYYVTAVWWGYDENLEIKWPASASTNPPPMVWRDVMNDVQADMPEASFPAQPEGIERGTFCRESGLMAGPECTQTQQGYYITGINVPETCEIHTDEE